MGEKLSHWVIDLNFAMGFFVFRETPWVDATLMYLGARLPGNSVENLPRSRGTPWHTVGGSQASVT